MDNPGRHNPEKPEEKPSVSEAPSSPGYSFQDPLRILTKREKSPVRIPRTSCISIRQHVLRPVDGAIGFSCNVIGPPVEYNVVPRTKRKTAATPEGDGEQPETEKDDASADNDYPPTCTRPPRKDVDYYESINNSIAANITSCKTSPSSKSFWEKTGAIPKYLGKKSGKTPPKGPLPPFRKPTPSKLNVKIKLFPDSPDQNPEVPKSEELSKRSPSTELSPDSADLKLDIPKSMGPPENFPSTETKLFPGVEVSKSEVLESEESLESSPSTSTESVLFPGVEVSKSDLLKSEESLESSPSTSTEHVWFPGVEVSKSDVLKSEKSLESSPSTSTESELFPDITDSVADSEEATTSSTSTEYPPYDLPKSRSDFEDDIEWVRYNCSDFQDYRRTVNNRQKAYENSLNRILPTLESSKKDVHRLAAKLAQVRSEVCDREETLKTQNDKMKYLVGRTMATMSKMNDVLEKYRAEVLAYTTLTTEGNMGIDMRLSKLLWLLCGISKEEMKARIAASEDRKAASGGSSSDFEIISEEDLKKLQKKP